MNFKYIFMLILSSYHFIMKTINQNHAKLSFNYLYFIIEIILLIILIIDFNNIKFFY